MAQSKPRDLTPEELTIAETPQVGLFGPDVITQSRPRDLSSEELRLIQAPPASAGTTAPLRIPPGTEIAIEQLAPNAGVLATASPQHGPAVAGGTEVAAPGPTRSSGRPDSGKKKR